MQFLMRTLYYYYAKFNAIINIMQTYRIAFHDIISSLCAEDSPARTSLNVCAIDIGAVVAECLEQLHPIKEVVSANCRPLLCRLALSSFGASA